tara:strand:+ start:46 stop:168 length:123 start_codon:yes stop_codon:yes gene_type:complete
MGILKTRNQKEESLRSTELQTIKMKVTYAYILVITKDEIN